MILFTPVETTSINTPQERPSRGLTSNLMNFCTPSKPNHFENSDEDEFPSANVIRSTPKQDMTPTTVNESPLSSAESVSSSPTLMSISSQDDSSASAAGFPKRLGFDKPTQITFDKNTDESSSSSTANYLVLAFALLLLRVIWLKSSSVNSNIQLSQKITRFESFEDYQKARMQFQIPRPTSIDQLPDIRGLKFYKLEQDESGPILVSIERKDLLGPPRPFSRRWMQQKSTQIKETSAFLMETSEHGIAEVSQDDHILI